MVMVIGKLKWLTTAFAAVSIALCRFGGVTAGALDADITVHIGGYPVSIELYSEGPVVASVEAECRGADGLRAGDVVVEVNGISVSCASDISMILCAGVGTSANFSVCRDGEARVRNIAVSINSNEGDDIGATFKEGVSGLGTVTFERNDGTYCALGHAITDSDTGEDIAAAYGYIYDSEIIGAKLPSGENAGRLIGRRAGGNPIGNVISNDTFGLTGEMYYPKKYESYSIAGHDEVKPGKASICSTVSKERAFYDIEIIKVSKHSAPSEKGMVIKITDENLLKKTGGILQGMSGSPIIQDGKIVGAVTHVFTCDPTRGYGVFAEWLL